MNQCMFLGNIGGDIETGQTAKGLTFANWSMAVKDDNREDKPTWFNCVAYGPVADVVVKYCKKGNKLLVRNAKYRERTWDNTDGTKGRKSEFLVNKVALMDNRNNQSSADPEDTIPFETDNKPKITM